MGWYKGKKYTNDLEYIKPEELIGRCGLCGKEKSIKKQATYIFDEQLETIKLCYKCSINESFRKITLKGEQDL